MASLAESSPVSQSSLGPITLSPVAISEMNAKGAGPDDAKSINNDVRPSGLASRIDTESVASDPWKTDGSYNLECTEVFLDGSAIIPQVGERPYEEPELETVHDASDAVYDGALTLVVGFQPSAGGSSFVPVVGSSTDAPASSSTSAPASNSPGSPSSTNVGAIAGGVVGSVVALIIVFVAGAIVRRRSRARGKVEPFRERASLVDDSSPESPRTPLWSLKSKGSLASPASLNRPTEKDVVMRKQASRPPNSTQWFLQHSRPRASPQPSNHTL